MNIEQVTRMQRRYAGPARVDDDHAIFLLFQNFKACLPLPPRLITREQLAGSPQQVLAAILKSESTMCCQIWPFPLSAAAHICARTAVDALPCLRLQRCSVGLFVCECFITHPPTPTDRRRCELSRSVFLPSMASKNFWVETYAVTCLLQ